MMLRNIVYIHNQLVEYGDSNIFIKGFGCDSHLHHMDEDQAQEEEKKESEEDDEDDEDKKYDMCPLKIIMEALGNQFILLRIIA